MGTHEDDQTVEELLEQEEMEVAEELAEKEAKLLWLEFAVVSV